MREQGKHQPGECRGAGTGRLTPEGGLLKKQIAGALVASLMFGSVPSWAGVETATAKTAADESAQRAQFHDSIDRAVGQAAAGEAAQTTLAAPGAPGVVPNTPRPSGPELSAAERGDLEKRRAELRSDPVARGAGGIVLAVLGIALSIGITAYFINKTKKDTNTTLSTP